MRWVGTHRPVPPKPGLLGNFPLGGELPSPSRFGCFRESPRPPPIWRMGTQDRALCRVAGWSQMCSSAGMPRGVVRKERRFGGSLSFKSQVYILLV